MDFLADVAMWAGHGPSVDLFVKKSAIDGGAAAVLRSANVSYDVVIDDMQDAIDSENPKPEEIAQLQDRKGKFCIVLYTLHSHTLALARTYVNTHKFALFMATAECTKSIDSIRTHGLTSKCTVFTYAARVRYNELLVDTSNRTLILPAKPDAAVVVIICNNA